MVLSIENFLTQNEIETLTSAIADIMKFIIGQEMDETAQDVFPSNEVRLFRYFIRLQIDEQTPLNSRVEIYATSVSPSYIYSYPIADLFLD